MSPLRGKDRHEFPLSAETDLPARRLSRLSSTLCCTQDWHRVTTSEQITPVPCADGAVAVRAATNVHATSGVHTRSLEIAVEVTFALLVALFE
jgi:hypothetical protein